MTDLPENSVLIGASLVFLSEEPGDAVVIERYNSECSYDGKTVVECSSIVMTDCKTGDEVVRNSYL